MNSVILSGNLGNNPEVRTTQSGQTVATFRLATSGGKDSNGKPRTDWHSVVTFGKLAENCASYLKTGQFVVLRGRLQSRSWDDHEGVKRYATEVVAEVVDFGPKPKTADAGDDAETAPSFDFGANAPDDDSAGGELEDDEKPAAAKPSKRGAKKT